MSLLTVDEATLCERAMVAINVAKKLGADAAASTARAGAGIRTTVRDGRVETALRDASQSLSLTVFRGARSGTASTTALDSASIRRAAEEALAIASAVDPDPDAMLADPGTLAVDGPAPVLYAPVEADVRALREMALEIDGLTRSRADASGAQARVGEVGAVLGEGRMALALSTGFCRSISSSSHARWTTVLAEGAEGAVNDYAETTDRRIGKLRAIDDIAQDAVERAVSRLGGRPAPSGRAPVILEARVAPVLVRDLVGALSGNAQYRRMSFLTGMIGQQITASHLDLHEDPFEPYGLASGGFDSEGVAGRMRPVVRAGVAEGYFLGTLSARRLGMTSTGNAGGPWNLRFASRAGGGSARDLCRTMGRGLVVTSFLGGATDPVTGNWTRAVAGFWVENGEIAYPVTDTTVGGNLRDMLHAIVAVGDDVERSGFVRTGSILIDDLQIGGAQ